MSRRTDPREAATRRPPRGTPRLTPWARAQRGSALVVVLAIIAATLLIGSALFILGTSEADVVQYTVDNERALWLAEAGLERAITWFEQAFDVGAGLPGVGDGVTDEPLRGGTYTFVITDTVGQPHALPLFAVLSTGDKDGVIRQVRSKIEAESFSRFQWFIESGGGGWSWFLTGEYFEGPVHVNGDLKIDGDPYFGGLVTAGGGLTMKQGSNPTFVRGYRLHVDQIDLPTLPEVQSTLKAAAQEPGGLYLGSLPGNDPYYDVELGHPAPGYLTYTGYDSHGNVVVGPTPVDISLLNGAAWFDETIRIWGVLDGQLTIGVDSNIEIMDDITYAGSTHGSGPDPDCDDVLGLIAAGHPQGDIIIRSTPANMSDCEIHAVMMALQKNIEAEDYQHGPPRGTLTIYGSMLADYSIHLAEYGPSGGLTSGYLREYHYDNRGFVMPPPFYPYTGEFKVISWEEVAPPVIS
jgi:hypothetical protein